MSGSNITTLTAPQLYQGDSLTFSLSGTINEDDTFVEPVVSFSSSSPVGNCKITMETSATAPSDGSNPHSPPPVGYVGAFTTNGTFTNDGSTVGTFILQCSVLNSEDSVLLIPVAPPIPESAGFNPSSFQRVPFIS